MNAKPLFLRALVFVIMLSVLLPQAVSADSSVQAYGAVLQTWITPLPSNPGAEFGNTIAMDGDTLVVGARLDSVNVGFDPVYQAGAVYVYVQDDDVWSLQARLFASDAEAYDLFGGAVAIDGDTIVVGAVGSDSIDDNDNEVSDLGAAYVFVRENGQWEQETKIEPIDGIAQDNFGNAVAVAGRRIVVAAKSKDIGGSTDTGKVYSYYRSGSGWYLFEQNLTEPNLSRGSFFGSSLDYDGQRLVVGAQDLNDTGAAFVYYRVGNTWIYEASIEAEEDEDGDHFGASVSIDGETIVVGAPFRNIVSEVGEIPNAGAAYVFRKKANSWKQETELVLEDAMAFDQFGQSVNIDDKKIVAGATMQDYYTIIRTGSAHVYQRSNGEWNLQSNIVSGEPYRNADFGASLVIDDELIVVGEPGTSKQSGAVHIYNLEESVLPATGFAPGQQVDTTIQQRDVDASSSLQIEIPRLDLRSEIIGIEQQGNSWDVDWLTSAVGHLDGTAYPTHIGNTVLAGHVNLPDGSSGPFATIDQLQWGDEIIIHLNGIEHIYEVRKIYTASPYNLELLEKSDGYDWLTLITCSDFQEKDKTYTQRVIAEAVRMK